MVQTFWTNLVHWGRLTTTFVRRVYSIINIIL